MPSAGNVLYYLAHPNELRSIIQWTVWHNPVHERDESQESPSLKICFKYLDQTSRSFSAVIKELNHELLVPVCLFYLSLRGLDTIEDDMTLALSTKEPLLRDFYNAIEREGWMFDGSGPNEKDRELLVHFDSVVTEFGKLKPAYREIIKDICKRMGEGMADYQVNGMVDYQSEKEGKTQGIVTIEDYELYCHHVAGLVGEGLTRLFVESGLANPALLKRPDLYESMGQFLQQTNIVRDVREDFEDGRRFWPKAVWSKYVDKWDDLFLPENRNAALRCSSEMMLLSLDRADDCLFYLAGIRDQSVFNFTAIPQSMAIATMEKCFRNPDIFDKNVKISKGQACSLMWQSTQNLQILYGAFRDLARKIHKKNDPRDPNFLKISIACGRIEQFTESVFPSQEPNVITSGAAASAAVSANATPKTAEEIAVKKERDAEVRQDMIFMGLAVFAIFIIIGGFMMFIAWMAGARFDLAWAQLTGKTSPEQAEELAQFKHSEL